MSAPGGAGPQGGDGTQAPSPPCDYCGGTGLIEVEDPVLGGLVLAACPDCEEIPDAD